MRSLARVGLRSRQSDEPSSVERLRIRRGLVAMMGVAGAFVLLAALVVGGALTRFDQYAVDHWMPAIDPTDMGHVPLVSIRQLYPQPHLARPVDAICDLWTYPASALVSALVVAALSLVLVRRGRQRTALAFAVAWILANAAEVFGKRALERPGLTVPAWLAQLLSELVPEWARDTRGGDGGAPRHRLAATYGARARLGSRRDAALVAFGAHTPSDVIGGALLGLLALLAVDIWLHANTASGRAGTRSQPRDAPGPRASRMPP